MKLVSLEQVKNNRDLISKPKLNEYVIILEDVKKEDLDKIYKFFRNPINNIKKS